MARGINKVILIGNLGSEPEVKYMASGDAVANFSVATSESWKDKQTGEQQERTEWHRVSMFARLAEIAGEYLKKGSKVYIEGSLRTRKWQDQSGADRYITEIIASNMQMLDSRGANNAMPGNYSVPNNSSSDFNAYGAGAQSQPQKPGSITAPVAHAFDDEIPF